MKDKICVVRHQKIFDLYLGLALSVPFSGTHEIERDKLSAKSSLPDINLPFPHSGQLVNAARARKKSAT